MYSYLRQEFKCNQTFEWMLYLAASFYHCEMFFGWESFKPCSFQSISAANSAYCEINFLGCRALTSHKLSLSLLLFLSLIICERTLYQHISHWGVYIFRASWRTQAPSRTILNCIINLIHTKCVIECECKCSWIHKAHMVFIGNIHHGKGYDMRIGEIENDWEWERKLGPARTVVHTNKKKKKMNAITWNSKIHNPTNERMLTSSMSYECVYETNTETHKPNQNEDRERESKKKIVD